MSNKYEKTKKEDQTEQKEQNHAIALLKFLVVLNNTSQKKITMENKDIDTKLIPNTEFIISYREKKELLRLLSNCKTIPTELSYLSMALAIINTYVFFDDELMRIFNYLCKNADTIDKKSKLTSLACLKKFTCADTIPQPYYNHIKSILGEKRVVIGDLSNYNSYVLFMIGKAIGFAFYDQDKKIVSHFDSTIIEEVFKKKYETLSQKQ
jgi:hypothetical protein